MTPDNEPGKLAQSVKAIAGALVAFGGALAIIAVDPSTTALLPQHWSQWIAAASAMLLAFGGVFGIRNARTVAQAQSDLDRALDRRPRGRVRKAPVRRRAARRAPIRHPSAPHPAAAVGEVDDDPPRHAAPDAPEA